MRQSRIGDLRLAETQERELAQPAKVLQPAPEIFEP